VEEKKLNKEQRQAVEFGKGPLLIIAGAGTGKTTVITERIKKLIIGGKVKTEEVLALTFTEKAAQEMEERVDIALPYGYSQMWISTFHSFCDRVLRREALNIGLSPDFKLLTQAREVKLFTDHLFSFKLNYFRPLGNPTKFVIGILQHFSRLKDEDVSVREYLAFAKSLPVGKQEEREEKAKTLELARVYRDYERLKEKQNRLGFADLIDKTIRLFRERRSILVKYQKQFKFILVDEFQDTNYSQYMLLKLLAPVKNNPNLTTVADDSQSVYKFRGAAISNVLQFKKDYSKAKLVTLIKNYRSSQTILDGAYRLIKNNDPDTLESKLGIDKNLHSATDQKEIPLKFFYAQVQEDEVQLVAQEIRKLIDQGVAKKEIAILVRANNHAENFARALGRLNVPYQFLGPGQLLRQAEVKDLIAYLSLLDDFSNGVAFYRVLSMPVFAVSGRDLAAMGNFAKRQNLSLFEAAEQIEKIFVVQETREKITEFVKMVHRHLDLIHKETAGQILYYFLQDSGLLKKLTKIDSEAEEKQAQNMAKFFDRIKSFEAENEDASVSAVLDWLNLSLALGESPLATQTDWNQADKVNLLTVHSSKGLEFETVFLVNLVQGRFPPYQRSEQIPIPDDLIKEILPEGDFHLQEERRLFYVGLTRAKKRLYLSASRFYGEGKRACKVSPFVIETLGEKQTEKVLNQEKISQESVQLSILDWQKPPEPEKIQSVGGENHYPVNFLSFSQINTFQTCPLLYRYRYRQRIPVAPSVALSFGDIIHKALQEIGGLFQQGKKVGPKQIKEILARKWTPVGFTDRSQEKRSKIEGVKILKQFIDDFDSQTKIIALETPFAIRFNPQLKIGGKIDRLDKAGQGLEIIDYKTGRVWSQKEVDDSLQMTVYGLAAAGPGLYHTEPEKVKFTFHFLNGGIKISTRRTKKELILAKKQIEKMATEISQSDLEPTPSRWCNFCDYKLICEAWK